MEFIKKFKTVNHVISSKIEWVGIFAYLFMMAITCVDVIGAKLFRAPMPGSVDLVMIAQIVAISFAASMSLKLRKHIQVEVFVILLPRRLRSFTDSLVNLFGLIVFVLLVWQLFEYGYSFYRGGEVSGTVRLPLWIIAYGSAFALIPMVLVCLEHFIESVMEVIHDKS